MRATICALMDTPGELELAESWLAEHASALTYVSEEGGCGCCVVIWNVEGPEGIVSTLPKHLDSGSDWASNTIRRDA